MPNVIQPPADTLLQEDDPLIIPPIVVPGDERFVVVPSPSRPEPLLPQVHKVPSVLTAAV